MTALAGRVAVVTGGGSGIGRALAHRLAAEGATVAVADIDEREAAVTAAAVGGRAYRVDVADPAALEVLAAAVAADLGVVGILANNAGVASLAPLSEMTESDWSWLLGVNLLGTIRGVAAFLPQLRAERGHILNTGSMAGFAADPGMGGYGVTKSALTAYSEVLAHELADDGVGVTLLAPGPVRTHLGRSSRNRPAGSAGGLRDKDLAVDGGTDLPWLDSDEVAAVAVRAVAEDRLYAFTHAEWRDILAARHRRIERAFGPALTPRTGDA